MLCPSFAFSHTHSSQTAWEFVNLDADGWAMLGPNAERGRKILNFDPALPPAPLPWLSLVCLRDLSGHHTLGRDKLPLWFSRSSLSMVQTPEFEFAVFPLLYPLYGVQILSQKDSTVMSTGDFLSSPRFNFKKYLLPAIYMPGTLGKKTKPKTNSAQPSESWQSR